MFQFTHLPLSCISSRYTSFLIRIPWNLRSFAAPPGFSQLTTSFFGSYCLGIPRRRAQPLEPSLFPKLRDYFADFPYLHYSIDQRLQTLETCCGYEYDLTSKLLFPSDFQGTTAAHRTHQKAMCFTSHPALSPCNMISGHVLKLLKRKENSFQGNGRRLRVHLRCRNDIESQIQEL